MAQVKILYKKDINIFLYQNFSVSSMSSSSSSLYLSHFSDDPRLETTALHDKKVINNRMLN